MVAWGTAEMRDTIIAVLILLRLAFGFNFAFGKGQRGIQVVWIGSIISVRIDWV